jgi:hypothetical protein
MKTKCYKGKNKLIAEFMGATFKENTHTDKGEHCYGLDSAYGGITIDNLKYHESWDWLMPVIKKIFKTIQYSIPITPEYHVVVSLLNDLSTCNIKNTYNSVVRCIKWHNNPIKGDLQDVLDIIYALEEE